MARLVCCLVCLETKLRCSLLHPHRLLHPRHPLNQHHLHSKAICVLIFGHPLMRQLAPTVFVMAKPLKLVLTGGTLVSHSVSGSPTKAVTPLGRRRQSTPMRMATLAERFIRRTGLVIR